MAKKNTAPSASVTMPAAADISANARKLISDIEAGWQLTAPVRALLNLAAESLSVAEQCNEITAVEGLVVRDARGGVKPHPAAVLARDARTHCSNTLQKLLLALG